MNFSYQPFNGQKEEDQLFVNIFNDDPKHKHASARLESYGPDGKARRNWIEYENGDHEPVDPQRHPKEKAR